MKALARAKGTRQGHRRRERDNRHGMGARPTAVQPPDHERLVVYHRALEAAVEMERLAAMIPAARADLRIQLRRASASVVLNVAEGAGEFSPPEKARFYRIARRSVTECMAILDLLARLHPDVAPSGRAKAELHQVLAILTRMVKSAEAR